MSVLFCTACGYRVSFGSAFCEECGVVFSDKIEPGTGETSKASNHPSSPPWMTWLDVGGKSLGLGAPLVAVFDFLSPRVALLPFAATIALVGLVTALALRKFVAPSLPATSQLRLVLAPEARLHKSPLFIGTGVLSALMVTGAAWSNANAPAGGVIASHFDAAKNAQMQLGVLQGVQKEQRIQTAVLEDIREGRTTNPRRELANQGISWDGSGFSTALDSSDIAVVQLFLNGGRRWSLSTVKDAVENDDQKMMTLLLQYTSQLDTYGESFCSETVRMVTSGKLNNFRKTQLRYDPQSVPKLTAINKSFLKLFCKTEKDFQLLNEDLKQAVKTYKDSLQFRTAAKNSAVISAAPGTYRSHTECKRDLLQNDAELLLERANTFAVHDQNCGGFPCYRQGIASDQLLSAIKEKTLRGTKLITAQLIPDIEKYCESDSGQRSPFDDFDLQILKQVIAAVS